MIALVLIPFVLLEIYLTLKAAEAAGFWVVSFWIVISAVIAIGLLKRSPLRFAGDIQAVVTGRASARHFERAAGAFLGGVVLLIVPGVLSDAIGIFLVLYSYYLRFVATMKPKEKAGYEHNIKKGDEDVIDVEIVDEPMDRGKLP